jgi:regulator of PEP synthase PpsR (kinase-PPPase family)
LNTIYVVSDGTGSTALVQFLGVSRTFKTPLSIYLAFKGRFVANVPIISRAPSANTPTRNTSGLN